MFRYELDEPLGLMVARHLAGSVSSVPDILRATRSLAACTTPPGTPKVQLLFVDPDATHPDASERELIAREWQAMEGGFLFAMVTTSGVARGILGVVTVLRGRTLDAGALCSFASCSEALTWIETRRPGVRQALRRLDARRKLNETVREERESC